MIMAMPTHMGASPKQAECEKELDCAANKSTDVVDPEAFFEDAPEQPDTQKQLSPWQMTLVRYAEKLYLFEAADYVVQAYTWTSQRMRSALAWAWCKMRGIGERSTQHEQQQ